LGRDNDYSIKNATFSKGSSLAKARSWLARGKFDMRVPLLMPDLDLPPQQAVTVSCWLIPLGRAVFEGDRLLELAAGEVSVDLPAPAAGRLVHKSVAEGDVVAVNQVLGIIQAG